MSSEFYFEYDASFRIGGAGAHHHEITEKTGLTATHTNLAGDLKYPKTKPDRVFNEDIWILKSTLPFSARHEEHIDWIWNQISPHKDYFKTIIEKAAWADLMLGCNTDCVWPVLKVDHSALAIVRELPVSLSFNFTVG